MPIRPNVSSLVLRDLRRILHNIDDHTNVLIDILSRGGIRGGAWVSCDPKPRPSPG